MKKIIALDPDVSACSNNAAFLITLATEMFVQHLSESAHTVVRSEKKPRKIVQYKDLANAVSRADNLEFIGDIVPKTTTMRALKEKKGTAGNAGMAGLANVNGSGGRGRESMDGAENGQVAGLLNGGGEGSNGTVRRKTLDGSRPEDMLVDENPQLQHEGMAHSAYQSAAPEVPNGANPDVIMS